MKRAEAGTVLVPAARPSKRRGVVRPLVGDHASGVGERLPRSARERRHSLHGSALRQKPRAHARAASATVGRRAGRPLARAGPNSSRSTTRPGRCDRRCSPAPPQDAFTTQATPALAARPVATFPGSPRRCRTAWRTQRSCSPRQAEGSTASSSPPPTPRPQRRKRSAAERRGLGGAREGGKHEHRVQAAGRGRRRSRAGRRAHGAACRAPGPQTPTQRHRRQAHRNKKKLHGGSCASLVRDGRPGRSRPAWTSPVPLALHRCLRQSYIGADANRGGEFAECLCLRCLGRQHVRARACFVCACVLPRRGHGCPDERRRPSVLQPGSECESVPGNDQPTPLAHHLARSRRRGNGLRDAASCAERQPWVAPGHMWRKGLRAGAVVA